VTTGEHPRAKPTERPAQGTLTAHPHPAAAVIKTPVALPAAASTYPASRARVTGTSHHLFPPKQQPEKDEEGGSEKATEGKERKGKSGSSSSSFF